MRMDVMDTAASCRHEHKHISWGNEGQDASEQASSHGQQLPSVAAQPIATAEAEMQRHPPNNTCTLVGTKSSFVYPSGPLNLRNASCKIVGRKLRASDHVDRFEQFEQAQLAGGNVTATRHSDTTLLPASRHNNSHLVLDGAGVNWRPPAVSSLQVLG